MAAKRWKGGAQDFPHVQTVTVTAYAAATTYKLTINNKAVSVLGSAAATADVNGVATALAAAWNGSPLPETADAKATSNAAVVTLSSTPGVPLPGLASSVSGGTGTIGAVTQVQAATGHWHWDNAGNWDAGAIPAAGDDVYLDFTSDEIKYGLAQSLVSINSLTVPSSFTGKLGLPDNSTSGYVEYRDTELQIGVTTLIVGGGPGQSSPLIRINGGSVASTVRVWSTASTAETNRMSFRWRGTNAANVFEAYGGSCSIAIEGGRTANVSGGLKIAGANVRVGQGVTINTLTQSGGGVELNSNVTALTKNGGDTVVYGTTAIASLTADAGATYWRSQGGISTALILGGGAAIDFSGDLRPKTVTPEVQMYAGSSLTDPGGVVTFTAGVRLNRCDIREVTLAIGQNKKLTIAP